jgi:hypothetical protein
VDEADVFLAAALVALADLRRARETEDWPRFGRGLVRLGGLVTSFLPLLGPTLSVTDKPRSLRLADLPEHQRHDAV